MCHFRRSSPAWKPPRVVVRYPTDATTRQQHNRAKMPSKACQAVLSNVSRPAKATAATVCNNAFPTTFGNIAIPSDAIFLPFPQMFGGPQIPNLTQPHWDKHSRLTIFSAQPLRPPTPELSFSLAPSSAHMGPVAALTECEHIPHCGLAQLGSSTACFVK